MLSTVILSGSLGDRLCEDIRYVETEDLQPGPSGVFVTQKIPVRVLRALSATFLTAKSGAFCMVKGRLEVDPQYGVLVRAEYEEVFLLPKGISKISEKGQ